MKTGCSSSAIAAIAGRVASMLLPSSMPVPPFEYQGSGGKGFYMTRAYANFLAYLRRNTGGLVQDNKVWTDMEEGSSIQPWQWRQARIRSVVVVRSVLVGINAVTCCSAVDHNFIAGGNAMR